MNKKILSAIVAGSVAFSVVPAAGAEEIIEEPSVEVETDTEQPQPEQEETPEEVEKGPSTFELVAGVAVIAGVVAAIGAGVHWAVQQRMIPNPLPGIIPNPPAPKKYPVAKKATAKPAPAPKPAPKPATAPKPAPKPTPAASYRNCTDVWNKLGRSIYATDTGFQSKFDRDGDGVGCENDPR